MKIIKKCIVLTLIMSVIFVTLISAQSDSTAVTPAYGTEIMDLHEETFSWVFFEEPGIPVWIATRCASNLFQNYMIAGQYIGFHEIGQFAKQDKWLYEYSQATVAGHIRDYYKGTTHIGNTSMTFDSNVWVSPDWIWANYSGNTNGNVLGQGSATYYAKTNSSFICAESINPSRIIYNSVSITVP